MANVGRGPPLAQTKSQGYAAIWPRLNHIAVAAFAAIQPASATVLRISSGVASPSAAAPWLLALPPATAHRPSSPAASFAKRNLQTPTAAIANPHSNTLIPNPFVESLIS